MIIDFIIAFWEAASIPLRFGYGFWIAFFLLYGYAIVYDKYHSTIAKREKKKDNFFVVPHLIGAFVVALHHVFLYTKEWDLTITSLLKIEDNLLVDEIEDAFFSVGFLVTAAGLIVVGLARARLNGYWGPHIYQYEGADNRLIMDGIYSRIRHPVYCGQVMMATGTMFLADSLVFVIFPVGLLALNFLRIRKEDADLLERFADDFPGYKDKIRALIPGVL